MVADDFVKSMAALVAWMFGNESMACMTGVLCVLRNRTTTMTNGNWLAAMSPYLTKLGPIPLAEYNKIDIRDPQFQSLLQMTEWVYSDKHRDITDGATVFTKTDRIAEMFKATKSAQFTTTIGTMHFFRIDPDGGRGKSADLRIPMPE